MFLTWVSLTFPIKTIFKSFKQILKRMNSMYHKHETFLEVLYVKPFDNGLYVHWLR